jgi:hypothetical protein
MTIPYLSTASRFAWPVALCLAAVLAGLAPAAGPAEPKETHPVNPFSPETFADPPAAYRPMQIVHGFDRRLSDRASLAGTEGIDSYLASLKDLGIGGVVANVGYGDYLQSPRQWEIWRHGAARAVELGMTVWLYDEAGYPSGSAGGVVTRAHPEYSALGLACYPREVSGGQTVEIPLPVSAKGCEAVVAWPSDKPDQKVDLREHLDKWDTLRWTAPQGRWTLCYFARREMYEGTFATTVPHHTTRKYIDVLNPQAVRAFIRVTHQAYRRHTPENVWPHVEASFTDEPLIIAPLIGTMPADRDGKQFVLDQPLFKDRPASVAWTPGLAETFRQAKGYDIRPKLASLFTGQAREDRYVRQDYWDVVSTLYARAFHQQIADWCGENGIAASGHVLGEEGLFGNIMFEGSVMRALRPMQLPGIDMLSSAPAEVLTDHLLAPKLASSVAHLTGAAKVQCETSSHKQRTRGIDTSVEEWMGQANILYAMGVNHLTLYRHWHKVGKDSYRRYADYVGRLGLMLQGGTHVCDVAVLYPIRAGWSWFAPWHAEGDDQKQLGGKLGDRVLRIGKDYKNASLALAQAQIDFDLIDEEAIQAAAMTDGAMRVAAEAYRVIVLPSAEALELETVAALVRFVEAGGIVLRVGRGPELADSAENQPAFDKLTARLFDQAPAPMEPSALGQAVRERIDPDVTLAEPDSQVVYLHRRIDGRDVYFFVNNNPEPIEIRPAMRASGPWKLYRPLTGDVTDAGDDPKLSLSGYEGVFVVN